MQYNGSAGNLERLIGGSISPPLNPPPASLASLAPRRPSSLPAVPRRSQPVLERPSPLSSHHRRHHSSLDSLPPSTWMSRRPWSRRIVASWRSEVREEAEGNHAGTADGFRGSASDHAVILRIQGRRHPAFFFCAHRKPKKNHEGRGEEEEENEPAQNRVDLDLLSILFTTKKIPQNNMKITSRHLTTSSLVFRSNLRLIPLLLLLFLGYTRGMPHVLRFGKDLLTACTRHRRLARAECLRTPRSLLSGEK